MTRTVIRFVKLALVSFLVVAAGSAGFAQTAPAMEIESEPITLQAPASADLEQSDLAQTRVAPVCEVWLVSARGMSACDDTPRLHYWRYAGGDWLPASLAELSAGPPLVTCVWSHGNWTSHYAAAVDGWTVYQRLRACHPAQPLRLIIWSWPADRTGGKIRKDAQCKAARADKFAYPLAWLIDRLPVGSPVGLVGFSYGARLNTGALHLLGGGSRNGRYLERASDAVLARPLRSVMLAAAMDNFTLEPEAKNGAALPVAQRIVNLYNSRDRALDFYPLLWRLGGPKAAGYTGLAGYGSHDHKVEQFDAAGYVRGKHGWEPYFFTSALMARITNGALFLDWTAESVIELDAAASPEEVPALLDPSLQDLSHSNLSLPAIEDFDFFASDADEAPAERPSVGPALMGPKD